MIIGIIIFLLLFSLVSWHSLKLGIFTVVLLLPTYLIRFIVLGIPLTFLECLIIILFFIWLLRLYKDNKKILETPFAYFRFLIYLVFGIGKCKYSKNILKKIVLINLEWKAIRALVFIFIAAGALSVLSAQEIIPALGIFKAYIIEPILFFIVVINAIKDPVDLIKMINTLGILVLGVSIYGLLQYIFNFDLLIEKYQGLEIKRITSFFEYPNAVGLLIAPILGIYIVYLKTELIKKARNNKAILWSLMVLAFGFIAIILARTEAALLAVIIVGVMIGLFASKKIRLLTIVFLVLGAGFIGSNIKIQNKIVDKVMLRDFSGDIRIHTYKESWEMLQYHSIFGAGFGGYKEAMLPFHQDILWIGDVLQPIEIFLYPHTIIFNFWTEMGILGVLAIAALIIFIVQRSWQNRKIWFVQGAFAGFIILLIHGLVDVPYFKNDLSILFWLLISIWIIVMNFDKKVVESYNKSN